MKLNSKQEDMLKGFCDIILCGHNEDVFRHCKKALENDSGEGCGVANVLYALSGFDADEMIEPQFYLVSTDAGAPELDDFFCYVENIKKARDLSFPVDSDRFSDSDAIDLWLEELSQQLDGAYIIHFAEGSEDYHFTIMNKSDCQKAAKLFKGFTEGIDDNTYDSYIIGEDDILMV